MLSAGPQLTVMSFDSACADSVYASGANLTNLSSYKEMTLEGGKLKVQEEKGCCCLYKTWKKNLSYTCDSMLSCVQNAAMDQKHLCKVATYIQTCPKYTKKIVINYS